MANITDPRAISFSNEKIRIAADKLAQAYTFCKIAVTEYYAENLGALYTGGDTIEDGAFNGDGRKVVTGNDALLLITRMSELIDDYEATAGTKLNSVLKYAVNIGI